MKISEIITDKYKLRIPPTVYYELLADVVEAEEEQEPTTENDIRDNRVKNELNRVKNELEPTIKNDLGVDCISREQALVAIRNLYPSMPRVDFSGSLRKWVDKYKPYIECDDAIKELPSVTPQEPLIVPIAEIKYDEDKLKELVSKCVLTVTPQEPILDKIRAEMDEARFINKDTRHCKNALASGLEVAMKIIDKYKAETEADNGKIDCN